MRNRFLTLCLLLVAAATIAYAADFAVIVNPSNPVRTMSLAELGKIFKAKTLVWPTGRGITVVMKDPDSPGMKFVLDKILGGAPGDAKGVLNDASRKTAAPVVFVGNDQDVIKIVEGNSSAIGVVDVYNITGGVKVVKIDDKQPFDPGYALKGH
jgi:ABC-type phosphate transport system substrate-binding protein